jgi:outer membrane lipoprotein SlyB
MEIMKVKNVTSKLKSNYIGTIAGAGLAFWAAKKYGKISGTWKLVGIAAVGAIAGAYIQGGISARLSTPKQTDIKK